MASITALELQKRDTERVNVFLDGEYAFSVSLIQAAALRKGQELSAAEIVTLRYESDINKAVDTAARFLSYRPRSVAEIRQHLAKKSLPQPVIDTALERLSQMGYVDDVAFARFWIEDRSRFKPLGPKALRYELRRKGVADMVIDEVLDDIFNVEDAAYRAAQQGARRLRQITRREFKERVGVFLLRRGFSYAAIQDAVARLIDELEAETPERFISEDS